MHWHAIATLEQVTKDMIMATQAPRYDATCNLVASCFALQHYTCRPIVENVVCTRKDVGKMVSGSGHLISIPWCHWMPKIESPGVLEDARKIQLNGNPASGVRDAGTCQLMGTLLTFQVSSLNSLIDLINRHISEL